MNDGADSGADAGVGRGGEGAIGGLAADGGKVYGAGASGGSAVESVIWSEREGAGAMLADVVRVVVVIGGGQNGAEECESNGDGEEGGDEGVRDGTRVRGSEGRGRAKEVQGGAVATRGVRREEGSSGREPGGWRRKGVMIGLGLGITFGRG